MMTTRVLAAILLATAALPVACTAVSTYPPTAGATRMTPSVSPGPELMASAIRETHRVRGEGEQIVFNLPAGLDAGTWRRVASQLPEGSRAMRASDERAYSVQQLRLSGGTAEVDVAYPERGVYQLMTVKFEGGALVPWRVQWAYRWVIPTPMPIANDPMIAVEAAEAERVAAEAAKQAEAERLAAEASAAATDQVATEDASSTDAVE
jgi:hypothetical protein